MAEPTLDARRSTKRCPACGHRNVIRTDGTYAQHWVYGLGKDCKMSGKKVEK